jgi:hypothetical protein
MDVFVARMRDGRGRRRDTPCVIWVACDGFHVLRGRPGEDKRELLKRWRAAHGATPKVVTIKDECRPSEVKAHAAEIALSLT